MHRCVLIFASVTQENDTSVAQDLSSLELCGSRGSDKQIFKICSVSFLNHFTRTKSHKTITFFCNQNKKNDFG